jgi:drug/metabolite transporter (DMT)-like permease
MAGRVKNERRLVSHATAGGVEHRRILALMSGTVSANTIEREQINEPGTTHGIIRTYRLAIFLVFLKPFGNLSLAWGLRHFPTALSFNAMPYLRALLEPFVVLGIGMQILWVVMRVSLFSLADLSFVLPLTASGYLVTALLGRFLLHEEVSATRWLGIVLLFFGIVVAGSTSRRTAEQA